jgi:hypothetical protein
MNVQQNIPQLYQQQQQQQAQQINMNSQANSRHPVRLSSVNF